jgi:peptide/nickel transport system permease protein
MDNEPTIEVESGLVTTGVTNLPKTSRFPAMAMVRTAFGTTRGRVGAALVILIVLIAVLGPLVAPHSPTELAGNATTFAGPSQEYPLGTDGLGRDVLSRTLNGGWELLFAAVAATALGVGLGTLIGVLAAYEGGWVDTVLLRAMDVLLAFPSLVLALLLVSVSGPSTWLIIVAVGLAHTPQVARVMHSTSLDICERDFMQSAELMALSRRKVLLSELVPNLSSQLMVEIGLRLTFSIVLISGLSFLGLGFQPPDPNWGSMINENRVGMVSNPWSVIAPVVLIALLTIGTNTFTDALARAAIGVDSAKSRKRRRWFRPRGRVATTGAVEGAAR